MFVRAVSCVLAAAGGLALALVASAAGEQASDPLSPAAGTLDAGGFHTCLVLGDGSVRCWGLGSSGQLGYGSTSDAGDVDTPGTVGPVSFGAGVRVRDVALGAYHSCAILDDGTVRCWGFGGDGRLGYGNTNSALDPSTLGPVFLGTGRTATAITAGTAHTCAILDDGSVVCWGFGGAGLAAGGYGRLGYGNESNVGDTPTSLPGDVGPVNLGGNKAVAITAGDAHTCAIVADGGVYCWGYNQYGQLGYGNTSDVGDSPPSLLPGAAGPVPLAGPAVAITAGGGHTCVIVGGGSVYCWGLNVYGQLGSGDTTNLGDTTSDTPNLEPSVNLGGQGAVAISAGDYDTCAILQDGTVRCWGYATFGRLGYPTLDSLGNQASILAPLSTPVDLGAGRTAVAISAGGQHTCALLDNYTVRCWGNGEYGELGYCNTSSVGETNTPGSVGPVNLQPGDGGTTCPTTTTTTPTTTTPTPTPTPTTPSGGTQPPTRLQLALRAQAARAKAYRACLAKAHRQRKGARAVAEAVCVRRYRRIPGRVTHLAARALSPTKIRLSFTAPGTDGSKPPAADAYRIEQATAPAARAVEPLCHGRCRFDVTAVGAKITLTVTGLVPARTYYYTITALDNVTVAPGPRSPTVRVRAS